MQVPQLSSQTPETLFPFPNPNSSFSKFHQLTSHQKPKMSQPLHQTPRSAPSAATSPDFGSRCGGGGDPRFRSSSRYLYLRPLKTQNRVSSEVISIHDSWSTYCEDNTETSIIKLSKSLNKSLITSTFNRRKEIVGPKSDPSFLIQALIRPDQLLFPYQAPLQADSLPFASLFEYWILNLRGFLHELTKEAKVGTRFSVSNWTRWLLPKTAITSKSRTSQTWGENGRLWHQQ